MSAPKYHDLSDWEYLHPDEDESCPFPVDLLPAPLHAFTRECAEAICCDPSYVALPLLSALAGAIGSTRVLEMLPDWHVPCVIWTAIIGESGTAKTPAFRQVMKPLRKRQQAAIESANHDHRQYETDLATYEKDLTAWKRNKTTTEPPPDKPDPPIATRYIVNDITVEAMAPLLQDNPRGLLAARDELSGWFSSFDRYSAGKGGSDAPQWLSMFNGEGITVDRKDDKKKTIHVPSAMVSVCGGIQPGILRRSLGEEHRENGLAARLLLAYPPRKQKRFSRKRINPVTLDAVGNVFDRLLSLTHQMDADGQPIPHVIGLSPAADEAYEAFYNAHNAEAVGLSGDLAAAWSKLEEYAARLALVIHLVRWADRPDLIEDANTLDVESMNAGISLVDWFKGEAERVYATVETTTLQAVHKAAKDKGGRLTVRDLQRSSRRWKTSAEAEDAINEAVAAGYGRWQDVPTTTNGGRPAREFITADYEGNGRLKPSTLTQPH